jgi:ketosteroid isomerase-like protein
MKIFTNFHTITLFLVWCLPLFALAQPESATLRKEIEATYAEFNRFVAKGDIKGVLNMLDKSFVQVDANGNVMTKDQLCKEMEAMMKTISSAKSKIVVNQIFDHGNEVVAWITMTMSFKMKQDGKWVPVSFTGQYAETLKKTPSGWKFIFTQEFPR